MAEAERIAEKIQGTEKTEEWQVMLSKEDKTLWVKVDNTETLNSFSRVIIEDGEHWCKVFYKDVDAPTEKTGEWITKKRDPQDVYEHAYCSECGAYWSSPTLVDSFNYCPNCGSRMVGDKE